MRINRKNAIGIIIILCLILSTLGLIHLWFIRADELSQKVLEQKHAEWERAAWDHNMVINADITTLNESNPQTTCNFSNYEDPRTFHRIYYNTYAQFTGTHY